MCRGVPRVVGVDGVKLEGKGRPRYFLISPVVRVRPRTSCGPRRSPRGSRDRGTPCLYLELQVVIGLRLTVPRTPECGTVRSRTRLLSSRVLTKKEVEVRRHLKQGDDDRYTEGRKVSFTCL